MINIKYKVLMPSSKYLLGFEIFNIFQITILFASLQVIVRRNFDSKCHPKIYEDI